MEKQFTAVVGMAVILIVLAVVGWAPAAHAQATLTWNVSGYAGTWDTTSTNWLDGNGNPAVFQAGDHVVFPTFNTLGGGSHYSSQTITVAAGGVSPGSVTFIPSQINYLRFAGGDIGGTAGGVTLNSTWDNRQAQLHFDQTTSLSFTGNVNVAGGNNLYYRPNAAGVYSLGAGELRFDPAAHAQGTTFNYLPSATGTTLTNDIRVQSGNLNLHWSSYAPTFSGDLYLDGNITFASSGGSGQYFTWTGDVILSDNRTMFGGVRHTGGNPLRFAGQFNGPTHTLTLDFRNDAEVAMQSSNDTGGWNVGNLILTNGNASFLLVNTTNPTDDHFAALRANNGKVTIQNGAQLHLRRGAIDFADLQGNATGRVLFDMTNTTHDVRLLGNGMDLRAAPGFVQHAVVSQGTGATGFIRGDISIGDGGMLELNGQYNKAIRHDVGDLRLGGGSTLYANWGGGWDWVGLAYAMENSGQRIYLGGGGPDPETITFRGNYKGNYADVKATFFFGTDTANVVDAGNVILRYESTLGGRDFNMGWANFANTNGFGIYSNNNNLPFRGGSAGTEFAPASDADSFGAVGPRTGTVFTATSPTRLVTEGTVGFYNNHGQSSQGSRGAAGAIIIDNGGTFDLVAAGTVIASAMAVQNGGSISGIGTFQTDFTNSGGTVAPGNSIGTLTIDGDAAFQNDSTIVIEIGGTGAGRYDVLNVTGEMSIANVTTLQVVWVDGYNGGAFGGSFDIFNFGNFNQVGGAEFVLDTSLAPTAPWLRWDTSELYTLGVITLIPEPTTAILLLLGICALRRRGGGLAGAVRCGRQLRGLCRDANPL